MVSRKWTCQLSLELTLPIDAAMPPSAITVCALPNNDLQMIGGPHALLAGRDGGPQPGATGPDDQDVVAVFLVIGHAGT